MVRLKEEKIPEGQVRQLIFLSLVILVIEAVPILLAISEIFTIYLLAFVHILIGAGAYLWKRYIDKTGEDLRLAHLAAPLVITLGFFGALILLFVGINYNRRATKAQSFEKWYATLFPERLVLDREVVYERIVSEREDYSKKAHLVPFNDVMTSGNEEQKTEAITKILKYFNPKFTPALVIGLEDDNPVIRVRAATAVARLEEHYLQKSLALEKELRDHPKDTQIILALAENYAEYANCAFVDQETRAKTVGRAIDRYQLFLRYEPDDEDISVRLGNLLAGSGRLQEAQNIFEKVIKQNGINTTSLLKGYLNILFKERNYSEIRRLCEKDYFFLDSISDEAVRLKEIVLMWRLSDMEEVSL